MKKNETISIIAVSNGFQILPSNNRCECFAVNAQMVFETKKSLFAYLSEHFDEAKEAKVD